MSNSNEFLNIFSSLESWLRSQTNAERSASFYELVEKASRVHAAVRRYKDDLKEFADLRNAIVHERTDGHVIAEPNLRAVAEFDRIRKAFLDPPKLIPKFQMKVKSRIATDSVGSAVRDMREGSFSQLPVLSDGRVVDLLTSETVVRWLASEFGNELVSLWETSILDVLPHAEDQDHYCFLPRGATLFDALACFEDFASRGKDLDAILVTHSGKPDQELLGILTVYDLPDVLESLGLRRVSTA
jgi:CBS domain-containing protein